MCSTIIYFHTHDVGGPYVVTRLIWTLILMLQAKNYVEWKGLTIGSHTLGDLNIYIWCLKNEFSQTRSYCALFRLGPTLIHYAIHIWRCITRSDWICPSLYSIILHNSLVVLCATKALGETSVSYK